MTLLSGNHRKLENLWKIGYFSEVFSKKIPNYWQCSKFFNKILPWIHKSSQNVQKFPNLSRFLKKIPNYNWERCYSITTPTSEFFKEKQKFYLKVFEYTLTQCSFKIKNLLQRMLSVTSLNLHVCLSLNVITPKYYNLKEDWDWDVALLISSKFCFFLNFWGNFSFILWS